MKNILILGSSSGLGSFLKKKFLSEKNNVITLNRKKIGKNIIKDNDYIANFASDKSIVKQIKKIQKKFHKIDIFINCIATEGKINEPYLKNINHWRNTFNVNLFINILIINKIIEMMRKNKAGSIIFFSGGGATTYPFGIRKNLTEYTCSKIALIKFSECVSASLKRNEKININTIAPGPMPTKMAKRIIIKGRKYLKTDYKNLIKVFKEKDLIFEKIYKLISLLNKNKNVSGKVLSPNWDNFTEVLKKTKNVDFLTLRRVL